MTTFATMAYIIAVNVRNALPDVIYMVSNYHARLRSSPTLEALASVR